MKLAWFSTLILLMSATAFACPAPYQGSKSWDEAVGAAKLRLDQTVKDGSHADEKATDGKPVRIIFSNVGGKLGVTLLRSTGGGKHFDIPEVTNEVIEACSTSGKMMFVTSKATIIIEKADSAGGPLTVHASNSWGSMDLVFNSVTGGNTALASDRGNNH